MEYSTLEGIIVAVKDFPNRQELTVKANSGQVKAINYPNLTGYCKLNDRVLLNTTAVELNLGTGGWHYVLAIWGQELTLTGEGHIMKLRYTPLQGRVLSVEEETSPHHQEMAKAQDLQGMIVAVGTLHSMLAPLTWVLKTEFPSLRVAYLMSDGAALPIATSKIVGILQDRDLLCTTITFGHAFGGDLEAVNIYSALLAAKYVAKADVAIVLMGPGVVGTNTTWGTTALEQGYFLNAVLQLAGTPIAIPRLSEGDKRKRHFGLSHHTKTVLSKLICDSIYLPIPIYLQKYTDVVQEILDLGQRVSFENTQEAFKALSLSQLPLETMGRGLEEDPLFFHGVIAAAQKMGALFFREE